MDPELEGASQINPNVGNVWAKIDAMIDGFFAILPNIVLALAFVAVMIGVASIVQRAIKRMAGDRRDLGRVGGKLARWGIIIAAVLLGITIIAPSVKPADLLAGLGVGSVAIGFAFKDILQNILAGILILVRQPFRVGDQIVSGDHEGTVERIETRATLIRTYDGRQAVIPNSDIYTNAVVVNTAYEARRTHYDVGIGYGDSVDEAVERILDAMRSSEGVLSDPAPEVLVWELAGSSVNLRARWWHAPDQANAVQARNRVIHAIKLALDEAHIDMPYPTRVHLFHDQTEATDGDRTAQREGWPMGDNPPAPAHAAREANDSTTHRRPGMTTSEASVH